MECEKDLPTKTASNVSVVKEVVTQVRLSHSRKIIANGISVPWGPQLESETVNIPCGFLPKSLKVIIGAHKAYMVSVGKAPINRAGNQF